MNRNPVIPYILIMVFGIGLIFFLSIKGLGDADEMAKGDEGEATEEVASNPEDIYKNKCLSCHGDQYQGVVGPALKGLSDKYSVDDVKDILLNGKGSMPGNLVPADQLDAMAEWVLNLE